MAGFRKAAPQQAAVKMSLYGPAGSGKTFTALLFAEGIARSLGKRVAVVDTERGTDFYAAPVPGRDPHPEAFDFDALYTRSVTDVLSSVRGLKFEDHCAIVIDSVSHLWDTAIASYNGPRPGGQIPFHAWGPIKSQYKALMKFLVDSPYHVFILGRQGNVWGTDENGASQNEGFKMRAEGETQYEPHVCLRMEPQRVQKKGNRTVVMKEQTVAAVVEKDRTGTLQGRLIEWPTFASVIAPMLGIMGNVQAETPDDNAAAEHDAEAQANAAREKSQSSAELRREYTARFDLCKTQKELDAVAKLLTPVEKKRFVAADLDAVRSHYAQRTAALKGAVEPQGQNPDAD